MTSVNFEFISGIGVNFEEFNFEINVKANFEVNFEFNFQINFEFKTLMLTSELTLKLASGTRVIFEFNFWGKRRS